MKKVRERYEQYQQDLKTWSEAIAVVDGLLDSPVGRSLRPFLEYVVAHPPRLTLDLYFYRCFRALKTIVYKDRQQEVEKLK